MEPHHAKADRAFAHGGVFGAREIVGRILDEILKDIVEKPHHVIDEVLLAFPLQIFFEIER